VLCGALTRSFYRFGQTVGEDQKAKERAPIFLQFLACVAQLLEQFPCSFEFTSGFLVALHRASVSGVYGTFAANDPRERSEVRMQETTFAVWESFLDERTRRARPEFVNPLFDATMMSLCLWNGQHGRMTFWQDCYLWPLSTYRPQLMPDVQVRARVEALVAQETEALRQRCALLEERHALMSQEHPDRDLLARLLQEERARADEMYEKYKGEAVAAALDAIYDAAWREVRAHTAFGRSHGFSR
jgi:hypothetical protein